MEVASATSMRFDLGALAIARKSVGGCGLLGNSLFKPIDQDFASFFKALLTITLVTSSVPIETPSSTAASTEHDTPAFTSEKCVAPETAHEDLGPADVVAELKDLSEPAHVVPADCVLAEANHVAEITEPSPATVHIIEEKCDPVTKDISAPEDASHPSPECFSVTESKEAVADTKKSEEQQVTIEIDQAAAFHDDAFVEEEPLGTLDDSVVNVSQHATAESVLSVPEETLAYDDTAEVPPTPSVEKLLDSKHEAISVEITKENPATDDTQLVDDTTSDINEDSKSTPALVEAVEVAASEQRQEEQPGPAVEDNLERDHINEPAEQEDTAVLEEVTPAKDKVEGTVENGSTTEVEDEPERTPCDDVEEVAPETPTKDNADQPETIIDTELRGDETVETANDPATEDDIEPESLDSSLLVSAYALIHEDDFDAAISSIHDAEFTRFLGADESWSIPQLVEKGKSEKDAVKERLANRATTRFNLQNLRLEQASRALTIDGFAPAQVLSKENLSVVKTRIPTAPSLPESVQEKTTEMQTSKGEASGIHSRSASSRLVTRFHTDHIFLVMLTDTYAVA